MSHNDPETADDRVHHLFEIRAERAPDAVAAVFGGERLTYGALNRRANQLARHLRGLGVRPDVLVAICVERSLDALVAVLGVLKAGGAYIPVDPGYPRDRVAFMLEDAGAAVVLTQARVAGALPRHRARVVLLDGDREAIDALGGENLPPAAGPDHLAYVIYTSGSTGRPKGAMLTHRGLGNLARDLTARFEVGPESRVLQFASFSFDASVWEMAMAFASGGALVMGTREAMLPGPGLLELLRAEEVTMALFPPTALAALPEGAEASLPALRTLIVGGEACPAELAARWAHARRMINAYGPTEVTVIATVARCSGDGAPPPIGKLLDGTRGLVLDAALRPVADGEIGELYLGGVGLARGYLGRPGLTASRFVPDPSCPTPGARLYRTGDLVRRLPSGDLAFMGRVDHQVKVRGHRIELGEIEHALGSHPAVREAIVVAREGRLVAYVGARGEATPRPDLAAALRRHVRDRLPEPMVPAAFVILDALPLTPNGKVDRAALPAPDPTAQARDEEIVAPRTPTEAKIAAAWAEALGLDQIGVEDDVFDLGGHSLLVARVLSRLRADLGVELPVQRLFEARTAAALARAVEGLAPAARGAEAAPIQRAPRDRPLPLSHGQRQLWLHAKLHPGALFYNEPATIRIPGRLDVPALSRALDELIARHEALRTTITGTADEPAQRIHPPAPFELPIVDLSGEPEPGRWERAVALATEEARRPFDLEQGPLFRATLVRLAPEDHALFVTAHHIVIDGLSLFDVLLRELRVLYEAFAAGSPSPLPELRIQYADYAAWQEEQLSEAALAPHIAYWRQQLADLPTLELPADRPRPASPTQRGARHCIALPRDLSLRLRALSREQGVTLYVALLAAFQGLLHRYARQDEIVVGTTASRRDRPETDGLVGYFLNMLVLRTDLRGDPTFRELLGRVQAVTLGALAHQDVPFATLVEALQPRRVPGQNPLFQAAFVLEPPSREIEIGWGLSQLDVDTGSSKFDLTLELDERPEGIIGRFEYSTELFDAGTIERMAGHYQALLEGASADPDQRLSALPLLTAAERERLLDWGAAPPGPGAEACVHRLFEVEAARSPDAVAVVFDDGAGGAQSLTYGELNRRANQLAHHLRRLGIEPEGRAAVCMYRSTEMIVAILGALKAGLAFVPVDPSYPTERIAFMLEQAQVGVLLTQARIGDVLPGRRVPVLCLDTGWEEIAGEREDDPTWPASLDQLAYMIFTSGSTGRPKGVAVPHRGLARLVKDTTYASFSPEEVWLQFATISYDAAVFEVAGALLNGGRLVLMPPAPPSLDGVGRMIREHGVTSALLTSGVFHLMVDERLDDLRGMRQLFAGGDVVSAQHVNRVIAEIPGCRMINAYGPTEASVIATCFTVSAAAGDTVPIGRPIPGTQVRVLDERLREVPVGVAGELYLGGEGLARGYFGRPDLTAERFVPDPSGREPGARLYRTGDRARWTPDGQIEFLGRADQQVKIRGFRIELGEIEAAVASHPAVREALIVARQDRPGDKRLVAYVVPHPGADPPGGIEEALLVHLQMRLPDYMIPSVIVRLDAFPLTPAGKVDRRALPVPEEVRPAAAPAVAPRSQLEERLVALWQEVLGLPRVGVYDNFFDLGGHSLLLMRLHQRVRDAFGAEVSITEMFAHPTINDLARFLASDRGDGGLGDADARARKQREILKRKKQAAAQAKSKQHGSA